MHFLARILLAFSLFVVAFVFPSHAFAQQQVTSIEEGYKNIMKQGIIFANICKTPALDDGSDDTCQCRAQGLCSLSELVQIAINFIILILGMSGSVALIMFVYGGFNWVFAQGRPEYIQTGKDTMKNAIIGLAIIFGAYAIVNFIIARIGGNAPSATIEDTIKALPAEEGEKKKQINPDGIIKTN